MSDKHLVLYVEDNPANMRLVEQLLNLMDEVELIGTGTAEEGLVVARERHPEIILMDINLPGMSGYEALAELQIMEETKDIPVIAISANALPSDVARASELGFADYLIKPINLNAFFAMIRKFLNLGDAL